MIRLATENEAEAIANIYNHYILNSVATFEEEIVSTSEIIRRIKRDEISGLPWFVAEENATVVGYAYATTWNSRSAYRHTVETTVYLSNASLAKGWGSKLYTSLFSKLNVQNIHVIIGGITLPNEASIALHEKFGMKKVAHFKEVGYKFDQWHDVGYWQVQLNTKPT